MLSRPPILKFCNSKTRIPDLTILKEHLLNGSWPNDLQPDHRQRLELLNRNLLIDCNNVVWVQCQPECPKAPPRTALFLPVIYCAPVLCQFRQQNPDLTVPQQVAKLQENYNWIGMKADGHITTPPVSTAISLKCTRLLSASPKRRSTWTCMAPSPPTATTSLWRYSPMRPPRSRLLLQ